MSFINKIDRYMDKHYKGISSVGFICAGIIVVLFYILVCGKTELHADCMDTIMWANATFESGSLFNSDFEYACLLPFGGQLLMLPFLFIFGLSYKVHIIGMLLFLAIFTAALIYMLRGMELSWFKTGSIVFAVLMMTCSSAKLREIFWGHIIYYSLGIMFLFVGMGLAVRLIKQDKLKFNIMYVILFIWTMLCAMDGIQAVTIYILPLCAALAGYIAFDFNEPIISEKNKLRLVNTGILLLAMIIGMVIMHFLSDGIPQKYANAYSNFNSKDKWFENLSTLLSCHYTLLGVDVDSSVPIMSFKGVINILRIIFATIVAAAPFFGIAFYTKIKNNYVKMFVILCFAVFFLIMIGWVFGKISGVNWRLTPIEIVGFILTILLIFELCSSGIYQRLGFAVLIPIIIYCFISVSNVFGISSDYESENKIFKEISLLEENGCTYGYATFWNANPVTVLTDNKIKVRSADVENGEMVFRNYQSDKSWYSGVTKPDEKYFILLTDGEYKNFNVNKYPVERIVSKDNFVLIILNENIVFK